MSSFLSTPLKCFCGRTYTWPIDLEEHRRARGHFPSHVCGKYCKHPLVFEAKVKAHKCGSCGKLCERLDILEDHRIVTGHCFCSDCDLVFENEHALKLHRKTEVHASEFKCCDCDILFNDIHALNAHMRKPVHKNPVKKAKDISTIAAKSHLCSKCQRTFSSAEALQQHCQSLKHKPLSSLKCPIGTRCRSNFASPSALLHHLESGRCSSEMTRDDINKIVQQYDKDHTIHNSSTQAPLSAPTYSTPSPSLRSGVSTPLSDGDREWSLISPGSLHGSMESSWGEFSVLENSQISIESSPSTSALETYKQKRFPCPRGCKTFSTEHALQQHMDSPAHSEKVYHCPGIVPEFVSIVKGKLKGDKKFTTLSGLTQHLESGTCRGGKKAFVYYMNLIQSRLEQLGIGGMRLLLAESSEA